MGEAGGPCQAVVVTAGAHCTAAGTSMAGRGPGESHPRGIRPQPRPPPLLLHQPYHTIHSNCHHPSSSFWGFTVRHSVIQVFLRLGVLGLAVTWRSGPVPCGGVRPNPLPRFLEDMPSLPTPR